MCAPQTKDLIQLMLDAKMENRDGIDGDEMLSTPKMATMAAGFMIEGFETITNLLSFTSYLLAMHPEVQEKLQSEIDEWFENNAVSSLCTLDNEKKCEECITINIIVKPVHERIIILSKFMHTNMFY